MGITVENIRLAGRMKYPIVHAARSSKFNAEPKYSVVMECSDEAYKKLLAKGLDKRTKLRLDEEDGRSYINLTAKATKSDGSPNVMEVVDKDGKDIGKDVMIGNGSKGEAAAMLITTSSGTVILRLKGIKVDELVVYKPDPSKVVSKSAFSAGNDGELL